MINEKDAQRRLENLRERDAFINAVTAAVNAFFHAQPSKENSADQAAFVTGMLVEIAKEFSGMPPHEFVKGVCGHLGVSFEVQPIMRH